MQDNAPHIDKQKAFLKLYESAHPHLARYCRAMVRNKEDARELISETILSALESFDTLKTPSAFKYFLIGIASRKIKNLNRRKKFLGIFSLEHSENIRDTSVQPEDAADLSILYDALAKLPEKQKESIILYEIAGMSMADISGMLGEKEDTVKSHLHKGRKKLRKWFEEKPAPSPGEEPAMLNFSKINPIELNS